MSLLYIVHELIKAAPRFLHVLTLHEHTTLTITIIFILHCQLETNGATSLPKGTGGGEITYRSHCWQTEEEKAYRRPGNCIVR